MTVARAGGTLGRSPRALAVFGRAALIAESGLGMIGHRSCESCWDVGCAFLALLVVMLAGGALSASATAQDFAHATPTAVFAKAPKVTPLSLLIATDRLRAGDIAEIAVGVARASTCTLTLDGPRQLRFGPVKVTLREPFGVWRWRVPRDARGGSWTASVACAQARAKPILKVRLLVAATVADRATLVARGSMTVTAVRRAPNPPDMRHKGQVGGGYPDGDAVCEWTGMLNGSCADSYWGYRTSSGWWSLISSRGFYYRNCTDFAAWLRGLTWASFRFPSGKGNAVDWKAYARNARLIVASTPSVGDIAWWGAEVADGYGFVAVVTAVAPNGSVTIAEYNANGQGDYDLIPNVRPDAYLHRPGRKPPPAPPTSTPPLTPTQAIAAENPNLLTDPIFQSGTTVATGWSSEYTTALAPAFSLVTSPITDGELAQQITYAGQPGDNGSAKIELYQAPISVSAGANLTYGMYIGGRLTKTSAVVGIEAFTSNATYISETDTYFTSISPTPALYAVSYTCPPGTSYVAVYFQSQEIGPTAALSVTLYAAYLIGSGIS